MAVRILLSKKLGELRWTQADLSRATGIRKGTICDLYNEVAEGVKLKHLELICKALECGVSDILEITPDDTVIVKTRAGYVKK